MTGAPITWGAYLRLIARVGVKLGTCEEAALSESGERSGWEADANWRDPRDRGGWYDD